MPYRNFHIFADSDLDSHLRDLKEGIKSSIRAENPEYFLSVLEDEYVAHKVSECEIQIPEIDFAGKFAETGAQMVEAERHPSGFWMDPGERYERQVLTYHLPFTGSAEYFRYIPNPHLLWSQTVDIRTVDGLNTLCFEVINFTNSPDETNSRADGIIANIQKQYQNVVNQLRGFNTDLPQFIKECVLSRKTELTQQNDYLSKLSIPIRRRTDLPRSFSIPVPTPKKIVPRPEAKQGTQEMSIAQDDYEEILKLIHEVGKEYERHPSIYKDRTEEQVRDAFLVHLAPRFDGSTTAESFNKGGKTDILFQHKGVNVFVAECKIWTGEKALLEAIDQIQKYLTWRDSKAALLVFVKNKEISSVIETIKNAVPNHTNYIGSNAGSTESLLKYKMHLPGDKDRIMYLSVLVFHFPD